MGKKKDKKYEDYRTQEQKEFDENVAESILAYVKDVDRVCILEGVPVKKVEDSMSFLKKKMKQLKRGEREKVYNPDTIDEMDEEYGLRN